MALFDPADLPDTAPDPKRKRCRPSAVRIETETATRLAHAADVLAATIGKVRPG